MSGHLSSVLAQTYHRVRKCLSVAHISQDVQLQCKIPGAESAYAPLLFFLTSGTNRSEARVEEARRRS